MTKECHLVHPVTNWKLNTKHVTKGRGENFVYRARESEKQMQATIKDTKATSPPGGQTNV